MTLEETQAEIVRLQAQLVALDAAMIAGLHECGALEAEFRRGVQRGRESHIPATHRPHAMVNACAGLLVEQLGSIERAEGRAWRDLVNSRLDRAFFETAQHMLNLPKALERAPVYRFARLNRLAPSFATFATVSPLSSAADIVTIDPLWPVVIPR